MSEHGLTTGGMLSCDAHGVRAWHHVVCSHCGALFDLDEPEGSPHAADSVGGRCPACACRLLPEYPGAEFSGRAVCEACAEHMKDWRGDRVHERNPNWPGGASRPACC